MKKNDKHLIICVDYLTRKNAVSAVGQLRDQGMAMPLPRQHLSEMFEQPAVMESYSAEHPLPITLILPSEYIRLVTIEVNAKQMPYIDRILPSLLEEQLAEDLEALSIDILDIIDNEKVVCAITKQRFLDHVMAQIPSAAQVVTMLPDVLALPNQPNIWQIMVRDRRILIRTSTYHGVATYYANDDIILTALDAALEDGNLETPESIMLYHRPDLLGQANDIRQHIEIAHEGRIAVMPQSIHHDNVPAMLCDSHAKNIESGTTPNLLARNAAQSENQTDYNVIQRLAALAFFVVGVETIGALLAVLLLSLASTYWQLGSQFRVDTMTPEGMASVEYEDMLDGGGGSGNQFTTMLHDIVSVFPGEDKLALSYLRYSDDASEIALRFYVANVDILQQYKLALEGIGYSAEVSANADPSSSKLVASVRIFNEGY